MVFLVNASFSDELKIAVVDLEKAVGAANAVKTINSQLDDEFKEERKEIKDLRAKIDEMEKEKKEKQEGKNINEEELNKLEGELRRRRIQYSYFFEAVSEKADERHQELMEKINPLIKQAIKEVIESDNYNIVHQKENLLHFDPKFDISEKLTEKINQLTEN